MFERFDAAARAAVVLGQEFARLHAQPEMDTAHLLAGLCFDDTSAAVAVLRECGVDAVEVRRAVAARTVPTAHVLTGTVVVGPHGPQLGQPIESLDEALAAGVPMVVVLTDGAGPSEELSVLLGPRETYRLSGPNAAVRVRAVGALHGYGNSRRAAQQL